MDFSGLKEFIKNRMIMHEVYQPVMLKCLLERGNSASVNDIANCFQSEHADERTIEFWEGRVREPAGRVLRDHQMVVEDGENGYKLLLGPPLSEEQRKELIDLCQQKIDEYKREHPDGPNGPWA